MLTYACESAIGFRITLQYCPSSYLRTTKMPTFHLILQALIAYLLILIVGALSSDVHPSHPHVSEHQSCTLHQYEPFCPRRYDRLCYFCFRHGPSSLRKRARRSCLRALRTGRQPVTISYVLCHIGAYATARLFHGNRNRFGLCMWFIKALRDRRVCQLPGCNWVRPSIRSTSPMPTPTLSSTVTATPAWT